MNSSVIQKPEGIQKIASKKINIPSESDEISYEQTQNNKIIKRGTNEQNIVKDEMQNELTTDKESLNNKNKNEEDKIKKEEPEKEKEKEKDKEEEEKEEGKDKLKDIDKEKSQVKEMKNIIDNENVMNNNIDNTNEEDINQKYIYNNELILPNLVNIGKLKQKPEKIKKLKSKIIEVPSTNDEILYEQAIQNNPIRRDTNKPNIIKDEILFISAESIEKDVTGNKENFNKDKIIEESQTDNENKDINKKPEEEKKKEKLVDNKEKPEDKEVKNIFDNENIINDKILLSNEEDIDNKKYLYNNELKLPNSINIEKIKQKPEKLLKSTSKTIDVPSLSDEIIHEQIKDNHPIIKDITKPNINKDVILEGPSKA